MLDLVTTLLALLAQNPTAAPESAPTNASAVLAASPIAIEAPLLARAVSSFGAATCGDWAYVYGGHIGRAHAHSRDNVVGEFWRFRLDEPRQLEELTGGEPLQGTALVAHGGMLLRIGGVNSLNPSGEPSDMHSTASVQRFDPATGVWTDETPLPEPRSSLDACVIGTQLVVAGGWNLDGANEPIWHSTVWTADLGAFPLVWTPLPDLPFPRRALAIAEFEGSFAVVGGMSKSGDFVRDVAVLDHASQSWRAAPELPIDGFGIAAASVDGALLVSGRDGALLRLEVGATQWQTVGALAFPRIFHRFVSAGPRGLIAIGGAGDGGHLRCGEWLTAASGALVQRLEFDVPTTAQDRQALIPFGAQFVFAGGNLGRAQHAFEPSDFVDETFALALGSGAATLWPAMPVARQSMGSVAFGDRAFVIGGFGHDGEVARAHDAIYELDLAQRVWSTSKLALPSPRTQFQIATHAGRAFVIGGANFDPRGTDEPTFDFALDILVLDPEANSIGETGWHLPRPRRAFASAQLGSEVWLMGGLDDEFSTVEEVDVLDLATGAWRVAPSSAAARVGGEALALDGRIWLAGGSSNSESGRFDTNTSLEVFDPRYGWSTAVANLPFPTRQMRMVSVASRLAFVSTHSELTHTASVWLLDPLQLNTVATLEASAVR